MPAVFLSEVIRLSPVFCGIMERAQAQEREGQLMHAAESVRQALAFVESQVEATLSQDRAKGFLSRWAFRLEDRFADRTIREAIEYAHIQRPLTKPAQVGYPLGVRNPGAVVRGRRYCPD